MARNVGHLVDRQIKRWRLQQRSARQDPGREFVPPDVITLSNALATGGLAIADQVGELLSVPVYGREIVEHIATTERLAVQTVESLDEKALGPLDDYVLALARERSFGKDEYLRSLTRTITALWGHGPCVLVGRGGAHIVSHRHSLAVRVIAPLVRRVRILVEREGIPQQEAEDRIRRTDAQRRDFVSRLFGQQIDDPANYDLVLNSAGLELPAAARLIVEAYRLKFGG